MSTNEPTHISVDEYAKRELRQEVLAAVEGVELVVSIEVHLSGHGRLSLKQLLSLVGLGTTIVAVLGRSP